MGPMARNPRKSIAFSKQATVLLYFCSILAVALFFNFIAPGVDPHVGQRSIGIGIPDFLVPVIVVFLLCIVIVSMILGRRIWLLYVGPGGAGPMALDAAKVTAFDPKRTYAFSESSRRGPSIRRISAVHSGEFAALLTWGLRAARLEVARRCSKSILTVISPGFLRRDSHRVGQYAHSARSVTKADSRSRASRRPRGG